jgi:hypothetical protein
MWHEKIFYLGQRSKAYCIHVCREVSRMHPFRGGIPLQNMRQQSTPGIEFYEEKHQSGN